MCFSPMPEITEPLSIDVLIDNALQLCRELPDTPEYMLYTRHIRGLRERLAGGRLRIAVLGQFNRGKSTFINALLGVDILPVSVLPITSVPTVISFGTVNQCTISFSDGKQDAVVAGEVRAICDHLTRYVTEQENPKNRLCVTEAIVHCESQLLGHGTVIIDTPGFGSTHTHNTETTLDLLASCDAALFLLSADLPITQVEVDFLHTVLKTVPRLFFVYNKVDLLNEREREMSQKFIRETLVNTFHFTFGIRLFPVSAKMMEGKPKDSAAFEKSGLAAVEKEVIDFLIREKYFTLSEALLGKFNEAVSQLIALLEKRRDALNRPLFECKERMSAVEQLRKAVCREKDKAISLGEVEGTALTEYTETLMKKKRPGLQNLLQNHLQTLLLSAVKSRNDTILTTALERLLEEMFSRMGIFLITELNKPLKKAAAAHVRELHSLADTVSAEIGGTIETEHELHCTVEDVEIEMVTDWKPENAVTLEQVKNSFLERFASAEKWSRDNIDRYTPLLNDALDAGLAQLSHYVKNRTETLLNTFIGKCALDYDYLADRVMEQFADIESRYAQEQKKVEPELKKLVSLIEGYNNVKEMAI